MACQRCGVSMTDEEALAVCNMVTGHLELGRIWNRGRARLLADKSILDLIMQVNEPIYGVYCICYQNVTSKLLENDEDAERRNNKASPSA